MTSRFYRGNRLAVILPCFNEAPAIAGVVGAFREALPEASIHVFDNGSTDGSAEIAGNAGASVRHVGRRGKGNVVRRMFADIEADVYLMADSDGTYDPGAARAMIDRLLDDGLDMVVGRRIGSENGTYRPGHQFGNRLLTRTVAWIFGEGFTDMLSGYRALSRRYVKSFPAVSAGFEIETELTIHALILRAPYSEMDASYGVRVEGTESKLATYGDGFRILKTILKLHILEKPRSFFLTLALGGALAAIVLAVPVLLDYLRTGLVPRLPTLIAATAIALGSLLAATCAVILDGVVAGRNEAKRLVYLSIPAPQPKP